MKQAALCVVLICLTQISCKKSDSFAPAPSSFDGVWRMIIVKDNISGVLTTKPSSIPKDVELTFRSTSASGGTFFGQTPTNDIAENDFSIGPNQTISIPALAMTKVGETSWGSLFVDNIRSARTYSFEIGARLNIETTSKTLIFQRL